MKAAILITSFKRAHLLKHGLASLARQSFSRKDVEIVVLNDGAQDDTESVCRSFEGSLNIRYLYTSNGTGTWRAPGFAINYGVKNTTSDYIILSCAEMYHYDESVNMMLAEMYRNPKALVITDGKDDLEGVCLKKIESGEELTSEDYDAQSTLSTWLPFFMGMNRNDFVGIGGYDEDFVGAGYDDNDIIDRMKLMGAFHLKINARVLHLWHQRLDWGGEDHAKYRHNEYMYFSKKGIVARNLNRDWGVLS